jgi:CBS domain containing-hemolysin-like protein
VAYCLTGGVALKAICMEWFSDPTAWLGLFTLILLELVLGIDNLVFIAILAQKLPPHQRDQARRIGLLLALVFRVGLLLAISWLVTLTAPLVDFAGFDFSGRDLIMLLGGLFLLYKATTEIHGRLEGYGHGGSGGGYRPAFWTVVAQIVVLDAVFSLDSVITAVGMTDHRDIMIIAVTVAVLLMMLVSKPLTIFVNARPTVVMLCLGFLLMVGLSLIAEGFGHHVPKGYLYAAIGFSVLIEAFNQFAQSKLKKRVSEGPDMRQRTADAVLRVFGARKSDGEHEESTSHEMSMLLQQAAKEDFLTPVEKDLLRGVLNLNGRTVSTIMTPRTDIEWVDVADSSDDLREFIIASPRARLLVCDGDIDNVLGVVRKEDYLAKTSPEFAPSITKIMQEPLLVHETTSVLKLLESLKKRHNDIAVVVDEFGGTKGVVTHIDLLESIAGEFPDHDDPRPDIGIERQKDGSYLLDGMASIYDVRDHTGLDYQPDGNFATIAGFILHEMGRFPTEGEKLAWEGWTFEILQMDAKRIGKVRLSKS